MLSLADIQAEYPERLHHHGAFLLRELGLTDFAGLQRHLLALCEKFDFQKLAADVQPFLFEPKDIKRVLLFPDFVRGLSE